MGTIDLYCERTDPSLWAEPVNAATNAAYLVSAWFAWRLARQSGGSDGGIQVLLALMIFIGIGSGLFHTFATATTRILDVLPIALFILTYLWSYCRRIVGLKPIFSAGMVGAAVLAIYASRQFPQLLNGSLIYAPALILVAGLGLVHLLQARQARYDLLAAAGVFVVALFFRTIDNMVCSEFPLGTHFLWHVLGALASYLAMRALISNLPGTTDYQKADR